MHHPIANGDHSRISLWQRVRAFAVPPAMIDTATARRLTGDWAGACAAAGVDLDLDPRALARTHGRELAARLRADLRHLAPDLLRWHLPRIAPDGLLRPGLTLTLARYHPGDGAGPLHLVVRTAPAWADAGQRIGLTLWDESRPADGTGLHPHPRPNRRFRLDLHRHLWDARRTGELRTRCGADDPPECTGIEDPPTHRGADGPPECTGTGRPPTHRGVHGLPEFGATGKLLSSSGTDGPGEFSEFAEPGCAVHRWAAEAAILLAAEGRPPGPVLVRPGARRRLVVEPLAPPGLRPVTRYPRGALPALPILPDAATWTLPDLELLRAGALTPDRLHPLVAAALAPGAPPPRETTGAAAHLLVHCRGERHRIGLADGVLTALDHSPEELRREELLVALHGTPLPCLRAIEQAHRRPDCLDGVAERLRHGDIAGALAEVEGLLGPAASLREGPLRDELEAAARRRVTHGLFRAGLTPSGPPAQRPRGPRRATRR